jgi:serine/threonine-protein kinase
MPSSPLSPDHNLLFAVLALQADLIDRDQFVQVCTLWSAQKVTPLAELLVQQGWLTPQDRSDVDKLLDRKISKHHGDVRAGLAEVTTDAVRQSLAGLDDEVRHSVATTPAAPGQVVLATTAYVPQVGERYTRSRLHATGGIGRVWLARDSNLARDVALKELRPERAGNPAVSARFLLEAQITGQLEHPGIVPIYELGKHSPDEPPFYTMRFVRGRTLSEATRAYHERRRRGEAAPLDLRALLGAFVGVCNVAAYAHSRGVLHRDLKPMNVVLGDYGEVVVLDWGLARLMDQPEGADAAPLNVPAESDVQATVQGQVLGTPAYMAPEQAAGLLDQLGPATDVYGLGAILYEILTGRPPFSGPQTTEFLRRVIHEAPAAPRSLVAATPRALEAVCLQALAKKPADRYASVAALAHEIQCFLADEPVRAFAEPLSVRAGRWVKKRRTLVSSAAALLVTAVVGLTVGTLLLSQANRRTQQQRDRADENFRTARRAVDDYLTKVSESKLLKSSLPGLQPLRKELLESALAYHEQFIHEHGDDPTLRAERAASQLRVGKVLVLLGSLHKGLEHLEEAIRSYQELLQAHPDDPSLEKGLADAYHSLGQAHVYANTRQAVASFRQAATQWEKLARAAPEDADRQFELCKTYRALGFSLSIMNETSEGLQVNGKAIEVLEGLVKAHPADPRYQGELAAASHDRGMVHQDILGQSKPAWGFFERARQIDEKLVRTLPTDQRVQERLGKHYYCLGVVSGALGKMPESLAFKRRGVAVAEKLARENPGVLDYQARLAFCQCGLAHTLRFLGQPVEALQTLEQARTVAEKLVRDQPTLSDSLETLARILSMQAVLHLGRGQFAEGLLCSRRALQTQEKALQVDATSPRSHFTLATLQTTNAGIELQGGLPVKAQEICMASVAGLEKLVRDNPGHPEYQQALRAARTQLASCRRLVEVEQGLTAFLDGKAGPASAGERLEWASLCQLPGKRLHATAARLAADAFTAVPRLANDLQRQHRYQAACSAALAAAGQAEDARLLPDSVADKLRLRAFRWLQADLALYAKLSERDDPKMKQAVGQRLAHWRANTDLASVRDRSGLDRLDTDERQQWQRLWQQVDAILLALASRK